MTNSKWDSKSSHSDFPIDFSRHQQGRFGHDGCNNSKRQFVTTQKRISLEWMSDWPFERGFNFHYQ